MVKNTSFSPCHVHAKLRLSINSLGDRLSASFFPPLDFETPKLRGVSRSKQFQNVLLVNFGVFSKLLVRKRFFVSVLVAPLGFRVSNSNGGKNEADTLLGDLSEIY